MRITGLNSQQAGGGGGTRTKNTFIVFASAAASRRLRLLISIPNISSLLLEVSYQLGTYSLLHHATLPRA
jgi:hypothetical protein